MCVCVCVYVYIYYNNRLHFYDTNFLFKFLSMLNIIQTAFSEISDLNYFVVVFLYRFIILYLGEKTELSCIVESSFQVAITKKTF